MKNLLQENNGNGSFMRVAAALVIIVALVIAVITAINGSDKTGLVLGMLGIALGTKTVQKGIEVSGEKNNQITDK